MAATDARQRSLAGERPLRPTRMTAGGPSGRALLITVLGEYVLPAGGTVLTSTLLQGMATMGIDPATTRQAVRRLAADDWLAPKADGTGRGRRWELTDHARHVLGEGGRRFGLSFADPAPWDGRWLLVMTSVPESRRRLRHQLRTSLSFAGFGSLGQGWWISADVEAKDVAIAVLDRLGLTDSALSFAGPIVGIGDPAEVVATAWDLAEAAARYEKLVGQFEGFEVRDPGEAFAARTLIVEHWSWALRVDPRLPRELLPGDWPGARATELLHRLYTRWHAAALAWWDEHEHGGDER